MALNFDVPMIGQGNSKCCWYACYAMMYGWKKRPLSEVAQRIKKAGIPTNDALYSEQWGKTRDAMGLISYRVGHLTESLANLTDILQKHGPMWCAGDFLLGSPHAIVISGVNDEGRLRINDPYEIYKYQSYNYLTYNSWKKLIAKLFAACQVWF